MDISELYDNHDAVIKALQFCLSCDGSGAYRMASIILNKHNPWKYRNVNLRNIGFGGLDSTNKLRALCVICFSDDLACIETQDGVALVDKIEKKFGKKLLSGKLP